MGEFDQNKSKYIEEHINNNNFINCNWRGVDGNECVQRLVYEAVAFECFFFSI